ncbi:hypothetical protein RchiOBHm_Chr4g0446151 [Rosa chinensis]|uniref:Uncharacterized protein n=1 Tax=Rosa chinensis TaxID=74649 RepID=A0A2P6R4J6_ROSCH|nr:hypothetical protein RchiOBHm_Chr4g0446151 [Rosa chinensis]
MDTLSFSVCCLFCVFVSLIVFREVVVKYWIIELVTVTGKLTSSYVCLTQMVICY